MQKCQMHHWTLYATWEHKIKGWIKRMNDFDKKEVGQRSYMLTPDSKCLQSQWPSPVKEKQTNIKAAINSSEAEEMARNL